MNIPDSLVQSVNVNRDEWRREREVDLAGVEMARKKLVADVAVRAIRTSRADRQYTDLKTADLARHIKSIRWMLTVNAATTDGLALALLGHLLDWWAA